MTVHRKTLCVGALVAVVTAIVALACVWPFEPTSRLAVGAAFIRGGLIILLLSMAFGFGPSLGYFQRACLGLAGGAMIMTVQSLLIESTPYELWAAVLASLGFLGFFLTFGGPSLWHRIAKLAGEEIDD